MDFAFHTFISVHVHMHACDELSATGAGRGVLLSPGEGQAVVFAETNPQSARCCCNNQTLLMAHTAGE